jgi:hypothetical protein
MLPGAGWILAPKVWPPQTRNIAHLGDAQGGGLLLP